MRVGGRARWVKAAAKGMEISLDSKMGRKRIARRRL
jgi:hypothetical protein